MLLFLAAGSNLDGKYRPDFKPNYYPNREKVKAAYGGTGRRKPTENAEQGKKGHLWMDTN